MPMFVPRRGRRKPLASAPHTRPHRPSGSPLLPNLTSPAAIVALRPTVSSKFLLAAAVPLLALAGPMYGQLSTADILGTVTDATGAVIPNATVTLINNGTQENAAAPPPPAATTPSLCSRSAPTPSPSTSPDSKRPPRQTSPSKPVTAPALTSGSPPAP